MIRLSKKWTKMLQTMGKVNRVAAVEVIRGILIMQISMEAMDLVAEERLVPLVRVQVRTRRL
jgi:hypothetical protein